jgi:hypothetical protein
MEVEEKLIADWIIRGFFIASYEEMKKPLMIQSPIDSCSGAS